LNTVY